MAGQLSGNSLEQAFELLRSGLEKQSIEHLVRVFDFLKNRLCRGLGPVFLHKKTALSFNYP